MTSACLTKAWHCRFRLSMYYLVSSRPFPERVLSARLFPARYICSWSFLSTATCTSPAWNAPGPFLYFVWLLIPTSNVVLPVFVFSLILHRSLLSLLSLIKHWMELHERQGPVGSHLIFASFLTENSWQVFWEVLSNHYCTQFIAI